MNTGTSTPEFYPVVLGDLDNEVCYSLEAASDDSLAFTVRSGSEDSQRDIPEKVYYLSN